MHFFVRVCPQRFDLSGVLTWCYPVIFANIMLLFIFSLLLAKFYHARFTMACKRENETEKENVCARDIYCIFSQIGKVEIKSVQNGN